MRQFEHPNMHNFECPICKTNADEPVVLIAIPGTEDGNIVQADQVHTECFILMAKMHRKEIEVIEPIITAEEN